jgi:hypothetical protein
MSGSFLLLCLTLLSLTATHNLYALEMTPEYQGKTPISQEAVQQKLQLVNVLLAKSPTVERASHSDNPMVRQMIERAFALYTTAKSSLSAGDLTLAEASLDEALHLIENAARLTPDPSQVQAKQHDRYSKLKASLFDLQSTYQNLHLRLFPKGTTSPPTDADIEKINSLIERTQALANDGHYDEAIELLENAHARAISALNKLLGTTSLMYDLKFQSPAEEFDYEMARYNSYEELLPIAYSELKPGEDIIKLSERYMHESNELRDKARKQASDGDHRSAINTLSEAVKRIQAALRLVGLSLQD